MAIITPSSIISEIRGSVGDVTYSRNRSGAYAKSKLIQTNPDTVYQQLRRAALTEGVAAWQERTEEEFLEWVAYTQSTVATNSLASKFHRAAYNEFIARYVNRSMLDSMTEDFPAWPPVRSHPVITSVVFDTDEISINWKRSSNPSEVAIIFFASDVKSAGIHSLNPCWPVAIVGLDATSSTGTANIFNEYVERFNPGPGGAGKRIFFAIKAINTDNFADSKKSYFKAVAPDIFPATPGIFDSTFDYTFN